VGWRAQKTCALFVVMQRRQGDAWAVVPKWPGGAREPATESRKRTPPRSPEAPKIQEARPACARSKSQPGVPRPASRCSPCRPPFPSCAPQGPGSLPARPGPQHGRAIRGQAPGWTGRLSRISARTRQRCAA